MIEIYNKKTGEMETVISWPTATPHFVITKPLTSADSASDTSEFFMVTHARSTAIAMGPFHDEHVARICAAVLGCLPMPWDEFSMAVSAQYKVPDPTQALRLKAAWNAIPDEIRAWHKEVNRLCVYGEL